MSRERVRTLPYTFTDENRSIHIHEARLPGPWSNYLSNGNLHALVSHAGGGFAWWRSALTYRLTRYRHHHQPIDSPGFYIYLREADGEVWSPSFRPCERDDTFVEAIHQPGLTTYRSQLNGLSAELSLFVLPDHDVLCWDLVLKNESSGPRSLDVFGYNELSQHRWLEEQRFGYYIRNMVKGWFDPTTQTVQFLYHEPNQPRVDLSPLVWLASDFPVKSWSAHRDRFLGNYGSERHPECVRNNDCGNTPLPCGEPCAVLQNEVTLGPGDSRRLTFFLGVSSGALLEFEAAQSATASTLETIRRSGTVDEQREKLTVWWKDHLDSFQADIPDSVAARMINLWTPVNCVHTGRYSRSVNQLAPGIRAVGYRDTAQDMLAQAYRKPEWAMENLGHLLSHQLEDGHALHLYSLEGDLPPSDSLHSDNHLWPPLLAYAILAETGDPTFLDKQAPYTKEDGSKTNTTTSWWNHLLQGIRFTEANRGKHQLPLTFKGDWNDIIGKFSRQGRGESVFAAQQYLVALRRLIAIAQSTNRQEEADWLEDCHQRMGTALLACAWTGQWWARGFDDDGAPVGVESRPFGKIFLNPQSWAVLAGLGNREQQLSGMDAAAEQLDTGLGLKAMAPGFQTFPEDTDPFAGYGPGCGENGSVFCHANTWAIIAECLLGRADRAWNYFTQLLPENVISEVGLERYEAEPYAWMSMITGPENERFGWANTIHISGTAAWMDIAATQYLLGIRAEIDGLRIHPCLPESWTGFKAKRHFAGTKIAIEVEKPRGPANRVESVTLDGTQIETNQDSAWIPRNLLSHQGHAKLHVRLAKP